MKRLFTLGPLLFAVLGTTSLAALTNSVARVPFSSLERGLEWRGVILAEKNFTLWDVSPIVGEDGKVHLFVARWPEKNVDPAWRKSSEIAHYIGDTPEGPFTFLDVVLRGTGTNTWDKFAPCNVEVHKFGDTYALLYIANDDYHQPPHPFNQRIGMAVAKSLAGPWQKVGRDGLILEPSPDTNHWTYGSQVVNPTLAQVGEKFYLYFKSLCQGQPGTVYGAAIADQLAGPYRITGDPLTTKGVMIEDGCTFHWQDKVCLISTDNHGSVTGIRGGGVLWVSDDGLKFNPAWTQVAYDRIPAYDRDYDPQHVKKIYGSDPKLERPKVLMQDGQPAWLYAAGGLNVTGGERAVIYLLRINLKSGEGPLPAPVRVACLGDSITFGTGSNPQEQFSYPAQMGAMLGAGFDVRNFGVGSTTLLFNGDKPYRKQPQFQSALDFDPDVVLVMLGVNDTCAAPRGNWEKSAAFVADARALLQTLRRPGRRVIIALPLPMLPATPGLQPARRADLEARLPRLEQICEWWREAARAENVQWADLSDTLEADKRLITDGVHPTAAGYERIARSLISGAGLLADVSRVEPAPRYDVVVSSATAADAGWAQVVQALVSKHSARVLNYTSNVAEALPALRTDFPRYACFVARPTEATREFVAEVHRLTRRLNDDPYTDCFWGILTGYDATNALHIARQTQPLTIRKTVSATALPMDMIESGLCFSELQKNWEMKKEAGGAAKELQGPDDTTRSLVEALNDYQPDLMVTSGHATEHNWMIGYRYRNGFFKCADGQLFGLDTRLQKFPIASPNPKIYLPVGNCLMGHIDRPDCMATAWMNSAGVCQMIGYTVTTWYGYMGWGVMDYFMDQPGRYTFNEAFFANEQALTWRLETFFPGLLKETENHGQAAGPITLTPKAIAAGLTAEDARGLLYDRDTVAFYGDPAWDVRMANQPKYSDQSLTVKGDTYTFTIKPNRGADSFKPVDTNGSQRGWRPFIAYFPQRVREVKIISGAELDPVVTSRFILVPNPGECDLKQNYRVVFNAQTASNQ